MKCSKCGFEAKDQNELNEHIKTTHGGAQERGRTEDMDEGM